MSHPALRVDSRGDRLRLLHVHAHPDDESSKGAATTAKYVAEGVDVVVATCTGGERGSILNPSMDRADILANIAEVRRQEMDRARAILGVEQVWLGFVDSGLPEGDPLPPLPEGSFATLDPEIAVLPLIKIIREFQPHVITTYDENGGYPHPDHIMCHNISVAAFDLAADPAVHPELGTAWQASKLYYSFTFHRAKFVALDQAMTERGLESPYAERLKEWPDDPDRRPGSPPGSNAPPTTTSGIRRCWPTRRRSIRRVRGSRSRWTCTSGPGRLRTINWPAAWWTANSRRTTFLRASRCPGGRVGACSSSTSTRMWSSRVGPR